MCTSSTARSSCSGASTALPVRATRRPRGRRGPRPAGHDRIAAARPGVTHVAVAFDSVVAPAGSTRGPTPDALIASQAPLAAEAVRALGVPVWPSGRYQADELLATAAARYAADPHVDQVVICSTDNDFNQCVRGDRVVVLDRIRTVVTDEAAVRDATAWRRAQIPDLFALVGDRSDGIPGVPGWGVGIGRGTAPALRTSRRDPARRGRVGRRRARRRPPRRRASRAPRRGAAVPGPLRAAHRPAAAPEAWPTWPGAASTGHSSSGSAATLDDATVLDRFT